MRKRLLFTAAIIAAGLAGLGWYAYRFHGPGVLRAYLSELRAKGEKVTYEELNATLSTNSGDCCLKVLSNAVACFGPVSSELTNARLPLASAELTNAFFLRFSQPGRAQVSFRQPAPPWASTVSGRRCSTWAGSSNRTAQIATPLRELRGALKHPDPNGEPRTNVFQSVTPFRTVKEAAYWLAFAALVELHDGRNAEALADVQALAGLANLHREEYSMVTEMTRVATAQVALDASWQALQATGWNDTQLASLQRSWEAVDLVEGLERAFEGDRAFGLEACRRLRAGELPQQEPKHGFGSELYFLAVAPNDMLFRTRNIQGRIESVRALRASHPWQNVAQGIEELDAQIERKTHGLHRFLYLLSVISIPNFHKAVLLTVQTETKRRLVIAGIALKRYQLRHRCFPDRLDALTPEFVATVPLDPFSGAPLGYRPNSDGAFALYSVGEDGKDDGGNPSPVTDPTLKWPPPKLGTWGGRDTVWPWPAKDTQPQAITAAEP